MRVKLKEKIYVKLNFLKYLHTLELQIDENVKDEKKQRALHAYIGCLRCDADRNGLVDISESLKYTLEVLFER